MKYKKIVICTADPIKDAGNYKEYLTANTEYLIAFHFFPGYSKKQPYVENYKEGKLIYKKSFSSYTGKNKWIKSFCDYVFFCYVLLVFVKRKSVIISNAPMFFLGNSVLSLYKSFHYVLWIGDYYEQNNFPMNLYNKYIDALNQKLHYVLYLSNILDTLYHKKVTDITKYRKFLPLGIKKKNQGTHVQHKQTRLGFIGVMRPGQGIELVFEFLKMHKDVSLEIVGEGYFLEHYKSLAKKYAIQQQVLFHGWVDDVVHISQRWDIGIALYECTSNNLSTYAEPTKIKDYLSYGLPVITTRTTYFHKEISKFHAGEVINENISDLFVAINKIKKTYKYYAKGVENLVKKYEYVTWYDKQFAFLSRLL